MSIRILVLSNISATNSRFLPSGGSLKL